VDTLTEDRSTRPRDLGEEPDFPWLGEPYQGALAALRAAARTSPGLLLLTGETGTGKTILTKTLIQRLRNDRVLVGTLRCPGEASCEPDDFLRALAEACGAAGDAGPRADRLARIKEFLTRAAAERKSALFVIDGAEAVTPELLDTVEDLLEPARRAGGDGPNRVLSILLVGDPGLDTMLSDPRYKRLAGQITTRCQLRRLTEDEVWAFLVHRLAVAGVPGSPFTRATARQIHRASGGLASRIGPLAQQALTIQQTHDAPASPVAPAEATRQVVVTREAVAVSMDAAPARPTLHELIFAPPRFASHRAWRWPSRRHVRIGLATGVVVVLGVALGAAAHRTPRVRAALGGWLTHAVSRTRGVERETTPNAPPVPSGPQDYAPAAVVPATPAPEPVKAPPAPEVATPAPPRPPEPVTPSTRASETSRPVRDPASDVALSNIEPPTRARPGSTPEGPTRRPVEELAKQSPTPDPLKRKAVPSVTGPERRNAEPRTPRPPRVLAGTDAKVSREAPVPSRPVAEPPQPRANPSPAPTRAPADRDAPDPSGIIDWLLKERGAVGGSLPLGSN
jgi:type II secretory pathway predicted ATPase ExeA